MGFNEKADVDSAVYSYNRGTTVQSAKSEYAEEHDVDYNGLIGAVVGPCIVVIDQNE